MKKIAREKGIIKNVIVIVVAVCVVFMVFAALARFAFPGPGLSPGTFGSLTVPPDNTSYYEVRTNPLLDFGDSYDYSSYGNYSGGTSYGSGNTSGGSNASGATASKKSPYAGQVYLSMGNIYTIQPHEEYLILQNNGASVDITGWSLTNGKGLRPMEASYNSYFYQAPDVAAIGLGTEFLDPSGKYVTKNIVLKRGDTAYLTTGGPFPYFPMPITTSFRENICTGYLENYPFEPRAVQNCPYPTDDPQVKTMTDECFDYMRSLSRCENPEKTDKARFDQETSICRNFMRVRLNYPSCVANNKASAKFPSNQWRVFLGKKTELWRETRETITLYDQAGLIVSQISY